MVAKIPQCNRGKIKHQIPKKQVENIEFDKIPAAAAMIDVGRVLMKIPLLEMQMIYGEFGESLKNKCKDMLGLAKQPHHMKRAEMSAALMAASGMVLELTKVHKDWE